MHARPVVYEKIEIRGLGIELIGSVHTLKSIVPGILSEIERFSPDYICVELYEPLQPTGSLELEAVRERYADKLVCIDRPIGITASRYMSTAPPAVFLKESIVKYVALPFNIASGIAFRLLPGVYEKLTGGDFYTFGWSELDSKAYIYERDEYMAGMLAGLLRSGAICGRCIVLTGRRHVPGMRCILDAFRYMNDIGSYYAGGRVYDVFSLAELGEPYTLSYGQSSRNYTVNHALEALVRALFLPVYVLVLFLALAAIVAVATAGALMLIKSSI